MNEPDLEKLAARCNRLVRFAELDAPTCHIVVEVGLVAASVQQVLEWAVSRDTKRQAEEWRKKRQGAGTDEKSS